MKKKILVLTVIIITAFSGSAQKFAYVDTDYILTKVPEFVQAEEKINDFSKKFTFTEKLSSRYFKISFILVFLFN